MMKFGELPNLTSISAPKGRKTHSLGRQPKG